jgi:hypothetical protein
MVHLVTVKNKPKAIYLKPIYPYQSILRRALNPDAVNFEFSDAKLDPVLIVDEIAQQLGEAIGYTNLSLYRRDSKGLILEVVFGSSEVTEAG